MTDGTAPLPAALRGAVMLLGAFDGMHLGHRALLDAGRAEADRRGAPLAILQCDPHPRAYFAGPSRFLIAAGPAQRLLLAGAGIELIYAPRFDAGFAATSAESFVRNQLCARLGLAAIITGHDFRFGAGRQGDVALLSRLGPELTVVADRHAEGGRISSSAIRTAIAAGEIARANRLLGHDWLTAITPAVIDPAPGRFWQFAPDQILPPCGRWRVTALDAQGQPLARLPIRLGPDATAQGPIPGKTHFLSWQGPETFTGEADDCL